MSGTGRHKLGTSRESAQCVEPHGEARVEQVEHSLSNMVERNRYKEWCAGRNRAARVPPVPEPQIVDSSEITTVGPEVGTSDSGPAGASHADREFDRFLAAAVPTETGGLRDPVNCSAKLARQIRRGGVPFEDMERLENDCAHLGRGASA